MAVVIGTVACPKCGAFDRYVNKGGNSCGGCARAGQKRYTAAHPEKAREMAHRTYARNPSRTLAQSNAWRKAHPEETRVMQKRWRDAHPEHKHLWYKRSPDVQRGANAVQRALKKGTLIRPAACEACSLPCKPEAAHYDYSRLLDVRWLCRPCHRLWDRSEPKSAYSRSKLSIA